MPATKKLTASRLPRLACEGAGPTVPDDAVVAVIFPEPVPQRSARQYRSSQREGFDAWRPPARVHPRQILKASDEAERSEAYHPLAWSGRLRVYAAAIVTLRSADSARPRGCFQKFISVPSYRRRTGGRHGARTARDEGQLSAHLRFSRDE